MTTVPRTSRRRKSQPKGPIPKGPLLTYEQAAERLGTTPRFPRRLVEERRIECIKFGRKVRIPEEALDAYIAEHLVEATN